MGAIFPSMRALSRTLPYWPSQLFPCGLALGALWGNGDADRWFGAGAMLDMGWARVGPRDDGGYGSP